jgi:hypothetical protein
VREIETESGCSTLANQFKVASVLLKITETGCIHVSSALLISNDLGQIMAAWLVPRV